MTSATFRLKRQHCLEAYSHARMHTQHLATWKSANTTPCVREMCVQYDLWTLKRLPKNRVMQRWHKILDPLSTSGITSTVHVSTSGSFLAELSVSSLRKIITFIILKKNLDQSIQKIFYLILKKEALLSTPGRQHITIYSSVSRLKTPAKNETV